MSLRCTRGWTFTAGFEGLVGAPFRFRRQPRSRRSTNERLRNQPSSEPGDTAPDEVRPAGSGRAGSSTTPGAAQPQAVVRALLW